MKEDHLHVYNINTMIWNLDNINYKSKHVKHIHVFKKIYMYNKINEISK